MNLFIVLILTRNCELGPVVNRDLSQRVRTVNGVSVDRKVVLNDLQLASRLIEIMDKKWCLWQYSQEQPETPEAGSGKNEEGEEIQTQTAGTCDSFSVKTSEQNPLLAAAKELYSQNVTINAEQENGETVEITRDDILIKVT